MRDLSRDELPWAVRAWSQCVGSADALTDSLGASLGWLQRRWEAGDEHLPLDLVHDLGYLLLRGRDFRFASERDLGTWPADERAERLAYEDRVLGRWALDPSVRDAHIAIAGMSPDVRDAAVAHATGLALGAPLRSVASLLLGNAAVLRARGARSLIGFALATVDPAHDAVWRRWAREQLSACLDALPRGRLFAPEDLWEIAHLPALPSESARLALREMHATASRIGPVAAATALSLRRRAHEVVVDALDRDQYPAGGFDAISTRGTFENLVRTEVAYVGEGRGEGPRAFDLFDVRFVEGELLYYTRDESPLLDARREATLVIDRPSVMRHKTGSLRAQTLVLVQGLALALQADLLRVFGPVGSRVTLAWQIADGDDATVADEERSLMAFSLASELAHRRVELATTSPGSDVSRSARVVFSTGVAPREASRAVWVCVRDASWTLRDVGYDLAGDPTALRRLADALLHAMVST